MGVVDLVEVSRGFWHMVAPSASAGTAEVPAVGSGYGVLAVALGGVEDDDVFDGGVLDRRSPCWGFWARDCPALRLVLPV